MPGIHNVEPSLPPLESLVGKREQYVVLLLAGVKEGAHMAGACEFPASQSDDSGVFTHALSPTFSLVELVA
jgi:hypothetical protein